MPVRTALLATALATALSLAFPSTVVAQVIYDTPGRPYFETFDHPVLPTAQATPGILLDWIDNETFRGWSAAYYDGLKKVYDTPSHLMVSEGRSRTEVAFSLYRTETARSDGALGSQPSDQRSPGVNSGGIFYGVSLINATPAALTRLSLSYRVELYRLAAAPNVSQSTLRVSYRVGGESLGEGTWIDLPESDYTTPLENSGRAVGQNMDGNNAPHATSFANITAPGLTLDPGQRLWLRWFDVNNSAVDHGIALDDVAITLLP